MDRLRDYIGDFVAGTLFEKSLAKTFDMSNRHSRNIDLTVRLTYANTNLLLSTAVGALLFLLVLVGAIHELPAVFTLPTDVGRIINQFTVMTLPRAFIFCSCRKRNKRARHSKRRDGSVGVIQSRDFAEADH